MGLERFISAFRVARFVDDSRVRREIVFLRILQDHILHELVRTEGALAAVRGLESADGNVAIRHR